MADRPRRRYNLRNAIRNMLAYFAAQFPPVPDHIPTMVDLPNLGRRFRMQQQPPRSKGIFVRRLRLRDEEMPRSAYIANLREHRRFGGHRKGGSAIVPNPKIAHYVSR